MRQSDTLYKIYTEDIQPPYTKLAYTMVKGMAHLVKEWNDLDITEFTGFDNLRSSVIYYAREIARNTNGGDAKSIIDRQLMLYLDKHNPEGRSKYDNDRLLLTIIFSWSNVPKTTKQALDAAFQDLVKERHAMLQANKDSGINTDF